MRVSLYAVTIVSASALHPSFGSDVVNQLSLVAYSRLVMFSFGFQQAFRRGFRNNDPLFFNMVCSAPRPKFSFNIL